MSQQTMDENDDTKYVENATPSSNEDEISATTNMEIVEPQKEINSEDNLDKEKIEAIETTISETEIIKNDAKVETAENDRDKISNDDDIFVKPKDKSEKEKGLCYCGKDRNMNIIELLCANCNRWFHESCIGYQLGNLVPFMLNYVFLCKNCSPSGVEIFKKNQATFQQLCVTAIANMMQISMKDGKSKKSFSKDKDIIPFIENHWESMTTNPRRVTQSWHSTVLRTLTKDTDVLFKSTADAMEQLYGLVCQDIMQIKPNYEAMIKGGHLKITDGVIQLVGNTGIKGRGGAKRKIPGDGSSSGASKRTRVETAPVKLSAHGYPLEHPFNKDGYRYFLAEPDPHAPFRQEFDESLESAGKPIPGWLYRSLCPNTVLIALHDRAPQIRVSEDRFSVSGEKGYCMARATHYVNRGMWYYEVTVDEMRDNSASRIGWGQAYGNLQTPLGFDKFGYSWRSRKGTKFHEAKGKHYSGGYGEGDILGFLIYLPTVPGVSILPQSFKDRPLVKFKSHLYYEEKDNIQKIAKNLKELPESKIVFFKNGVCQGEAFTDIYGGSYYPSISMYKSCALTVNFGPKFKCPPSKEKYPFRPMSERAEETICEQTLSDIIYLTEREGRLKLDL